MSRIVTSHYRYKPPPKRKKPATPAVPDIVTIRDGARAEVVDEPAPAPPPANDDRKHAIITARPPGKRYRDVPDTTPEEHKRRGDSADTLWRELVRRATGG